MGTCFLDPNKIPPQSHMRDHAFGPLGWGGDGTLAQAPSSETTTPTRLGSRTKARRRGPGPKLVLSNPGRWATAGCPRYLLWPQAPAAPPRGRGGLGALAPS
jgi:hypothetical protein